MHDDCIANKSLKWQYQGNHNFSIYLFYKSYWLYGGIYIIFVVYYKVIKEQKIYNYIMPHINYKRASDMQILNNTLLCIIDQPLQF